MSNTKTERRSWKPFAEWKRELQRKGEWREPAAKQGSAPRRKKKSADRGDDELERRVRRLERKVR